MNKIEESNLRGIGTASVAYQQKMNKELFSDISGNIKTQKLMAESSDAMTMEEYKKYLHGKISDLSIDSSQKNVFYFVDITDEGFAAMKNDASFESKVLDTIEKYFSRRVPKDYMGCTKFTIGASVEDIFIQSYSTQAVPNSIESKSFWERRAEREKQINERNDRYLEKKRQTENYIGKRIQERHFVERKNFEELARVAALKVKDPEVTGEEKNLITEKVISSYQKLSL